VTALLQRCPLGARPCALLSGVGGTGAAPARRSYFYAEPEAVEPGWEGTLGPGPRVGFVHYDLGWSWMAKPRLPRPPPLGGPAALSLRFSAWFERDEASGAGRIACVPSPSGRRCAERLRRWVGPPSPALRGGLPRDLVPGVSKRAYVERVSRLRDAIRGGELYQANFTYPLLGSYRGDPRAAFLRLAEGATAPPFAAFVSVDDDHHIVSGSPECLLHAVDDRLRSFPIKGTRPRHPHAGTDRESARSLLDSEKDRAEHLMIVDLVRNDMGRVARVGSVRASDVYVESFPTVHHLTTTVEARLAPEVSLERLWTALFPGGSITGAPKLRSMEWIDGLEEDARGIYTGSIVHRDPHGELTASIAIRTAEIRGADVRFGVGGGIVLDSDPEAEWEETRVKAAALSAALSEP
jgi:para-aminobenzoate synthetase component 1